jgi:hypothetical protein
MSSGSKKGTHIYYPFVSKSLGKRISSKSHKGAAMERDTRLQGIFTYLLIYFFISKALRQERPSRFPRSGAPMERDVHLQRLFCLSLRVPSKGDLHPGSLHTAPTERERETAHFQNPFQPSLKVPSVP